MTRKHNYTQMFDDLYSYYLSKGDNDTSWHFIMRTLEKKGYISCQMHSSKLYYSLYDDGKAIITSSICDAFRKYRRDSGASLFTWTTRLFRQALWRYIKERSVNDEKDGFKTDDFSEYEESNHAGSAEDEMISEENKAEAEGLIRKILDTVIENDIYREVYCTKKGILGYYREISDDNVARSLGLTLNTVKQANVSNKIRMRALKEMIKTYDINDITRENFNEFRKHFLKRNK